MQRLAVVCVAGVAIFAALLAIGRNSGDVASARQSAPSTGSPAPSIVSSSKVSVVASNLAARAMAVNAAAPQAPIDLTTATSPNQIFTLGTAAGLSMPSANLRMAPIAGTGAAGSLGDGGAASAAQFDLSTSSLFQRSGINIAPDGTIYIADTGNATIRAISGPSSTEPGVIRSVAGRWAARQNLALVEPMGLALDRAGNLYIADHGAGAVDVLAGGTAQLQTLAQVACPAAVAVSPDGEVVFVTSPSKGAVFSINTQTHAIQTVSGLGPAQASSGSVCAAPPPSDSSAIPSGVAVDAARNLFVADANSGRILRIDAQTSATIIVASGLHQPGEIAFDASGNLYAAEQGLNRIVAFAQVGASQGSISLSPASGALGNEPTGGASATQTFTLTNTTAAAVAGVTIPKTTTPADFTVENNNCTTTLAPNSSCTLNVAFTPTASGARSATLTVTDSNTADSASTVLSGTGDDYEVDLGTGQLMSVSVQAGSGITMNLQIVPDNVFSGVVTLVCPDNLPRNTTCTFSSPTVNVSPGVAAPFQVTFQTTGIINPVNTLIQRLPIDLQRIPRFPPLGIAALLAMLFTLLDRAIRRRSPLARAKADFAPPLRIGRLIPVFAVIALGAALLTGCKKGATAASIGATPSGSTNMVISGTSQNASRALSITLNVVTE
ncbi:MAG: choice-of-anchor D domain-containing protein [Candidatus Acidiferrales bacterium]